MKRFLQDFIHWSILGATGIFIAKTLHDHWPEVQTLQFQPLAGVSLSFASPLPLQPNSGQPLCISP
jgi:hypothetical protein